MALFSSLSKDQKFNLGLSSATALTSGLFSLVGAGIQNRMNIKNWQMQNEYNTPRNQMARFKDAGLNPNLVYERGDAGNAGSLPSYQLEAGSVKSGIAAASAIKQLQLLDAEKWKASEEAHTQQLENEARRKENFYLDNYLSTRNKVQRANHLYLTGQISLQTLERMRMQAQIDNINMSTAYTDYNMSEYMPGQLKQGWARIALDRLRTQIQQTLGYDEHLYNGYRNGMAQFEWENRESDRTFGRRTKALGAAAGAAGSLFGIGKLFKPDFYRGQYYQPLY